MTEPTITCPNCKTEIKLTESLAESTRQQFEQQLARKDSDIAQRELDDAKCKTAYGTVGKINLTRQDGWLERLRSLVRCISAGDVSDACANR